MRVMRRRLRSNTGASKAVPLLKSDYSQPHSCKMYFTRYSFLTAYSKWPVCSTAFKTELKGAVLSKDEVTKVNPHNTQHDGRQKKNVLEIKVITKKQIGYK